VNRTAETRKGSKGARKRVRRRALLWAAIATLVTAVALAITYAAIPKLVSEIAPSLAENLDLQSLSVEIDYPTLNGVHVNEIGLAGSGIELKGKSIDVSYSMSALRRKRVHSIDAEFATLSIRADPDSTETPDAGANTGIESLFDLPPVDQLSVNNLTIELPDVEFVGTGHATLGGGELKFILRGEQPDVARRFRIDAELTRDGSFVFRFNDAEDNAEFLTLAGTIGDDAIDLRGQANLSGYPLSLVSALLGLPQGDGSVRTTVETSLPWPLPDSVQVSDINAQFSDIRVDWRAANGEFVLNEVVGRVGMQGTDVDAALSGTAIYAAASRTITAQLPDDYPLSLQERELKGGEGLSLHLENSGTDIHATLQSFAATLDPAFELNAVGEIDITTNAIRAAGNVSGTVQSEWKSLTSDNPSINGQFEFAGQVSTDSLSRAVGTNSEFLFANERLRANGTLTSQPFESVPFDLMYNLNDTSGSADLSPVLTLTENTAAGLLPDWDRQYDLDEGQLDGIVSLAWETPDKIEASLQLGLSDGVAHYDETIAKGVTTRMYLSTDNISDVNAWRLDPTTVRVREIDLGVVATDIESQITWSGNRLDVSRFSSSVLGGTATTDPFTFDTATGTAEFSVHIDAMQLADVLALEGDDITGTGKISGTLPVNINEYEISVFGGELHSMPPGGTIKLTSGLTGPSGQPGLDFALLALNDFTYSELDAHINYARNGDLELGVGLRGKNPDIEAGRPIQYNLNITENIPVLLESLRLQDRVTERVENEVAQ